MTTRIDDSDLEQHLRDAFAARARSTRIAPPHTTAPVLPAMELTAADPGHTQRRGWMLPAAVAASTCLVIGGLVAMVAARDDVAPAGQPSASAPDLAPGPNIVITDPLAIDLDAWRLDDTPVVVDAAYTILDTNALPADLTVDDESGIVHLDDFTIGYRYVATLRSERLGLIHLIITASSRDECAATPTSSLMVRGTAALQTPGGLCWLLPAGQSAELTTDESSTDLTDLIAFAGSLEFATVSELPTPAPERGPVVAAELDVQFAGMLDGTPWSARVDPDLLRSMQVYIDGSANSGFENDRSSQPSDLPVAGPGEVSISGIPGTGAVIFGYTSPEVDRLIVVRSDGEAAQLPVLRRELESFFAVPVPDGLTISTISFVTTSGVVHRIADIPQLPTGLGGTYGGYIQPRQPVTADPATERATAERETIERAIRAAAEPFIGQPLDDFTASMASLGFQVRVTEIDGKPQPTRADRRLDRINVGVDATNIVVSVGSIG